MNRRVVVLDYGSGNLRSAERALARVGADVTVTADLAEARAADGLVVPGVGAFAAVMAGLVGVGGDGLVRELVEEGRPVLGICVGMQVLFDKGDEHGVVTEGLGLLPGAVRRLRAPVLPHMGWNTVTPGPASVLFAGLDPGARFYFVHSYAATETGGPASVRPASGGARGARTTTGGMVGVADTTLISAPPPRRPAGRCLVTTAEHGEPFVAAVEHGSLAATQFHPEKSGDAGATVLANWLGTLG